MVMIFKPGDVVAKVYRLEERVGSGGMGAVWRASHIKLFGRQVALKFILPTGAADDQLRAKLAAEAAMLSRLDHPNVCPILDFGEERVVLYLAMGYVDGCDLSKLLTTGRMSVPLALYTTGQILQGLSHAHERGVIHRDMKPSNVLVARTGAVKVTDFGIAKAFAPGQSPSTSTFATGSPGYIAPEILRGEAARIQTDIFGVGATLFELLSGRGPFSTPGADRERIFNATLNDPVPSLASLGVAVPQGVERIIQRSLAKDPRARYATANEMLEELTPLLVQLGTEATALAFGRFVASAAQTVIARDARSQRSRSSIGVSRIAGQVRGDGDPRKSGALVAAVTASVSIIIAAAVFLWWSSAAEGPTDVAAPAAAAALMSRSFDAGMPADAGRDAPYSSPRPQQQRSGGGGHEPAPR